MPCTLHRYRLDEVQDWVGRDKGQPEQALTAAARCEHFEITPELAAARIAMLVRDGRVESDARPALVVNGQVNLPRIQVKALGRTAVFVDDEQIPLGALEF